MKIVSGTIIFCLSLLLIQGCGQRKQSIREAVVRQLTEYPESTLQDIYKSFFQDRYGPGHLLEDTLAARSYFDYELAQMDSRRNYVAEPCGTGSNFYRVPLDLVKDGIIGEDQLFNAFVGSSENFGIPDISEWHHEWNRIVEVIEGMDLDLPGLTKDKEKLEGILACGDYLVHHSRPYSDAYDPHYRIVSKSQWNQLKREAGL